MSETLPGMFVTREEARLEEVPGREHHWYYNPERVPGANLLTVRCVMPVGAGHAFHHHPEMEEVLYVLKGTAEQWLEEEVRMLQPGDAIYIRPGVVHATYNGGDETLEFLAVLSPADAPGPGTVQVEDQAPWNTLRSA